MATGQSPNSAYLGVSGVAELLDITADQVRQLVARRELACVRTLGRRDRRFSLDDVLEYLDSCGWDVAGVESFEALSGLLALHSLRVRDVAYRLVTDVGTIYSLVFRGKLAANWIAGTLYFRESRLPQQLPA